MHQSWNDLCGGVVKETSLERDAFSPLPEAVHVCVCPPLSLSHKHCMPSKLRVDELDEA